jgi:hypothetical protein
MHFNATITVTLPALIERGPSGMFYATVPSLGLALSAETADELKDALTEEMEDAFPGAPHDADLSVDEGLGEAETV